MNKGGPARGFLLYPKLGPKTLTSDEAPFLFSKWAYPSNGVALARHTAAGLVDKKGGRPRSLIRGPCYYSEWGLISCKLGHK